jgi:hypothetical protein
MVDQQQRSANISNAADKFIGIGNQKRMAELEGTKYSILNRMYDPSGVNRRFTAGMPLDENGLPMYHKNKYGGKLKYMAGGMLRKVYGPEDPGTPVNPLGSVGQLAKLLKTNKGLMTEDVIRPEAIQTQYQSFMSPYQEPLAKGNYYTDPKTGDVFPTQGYLNSKKAAKKS